MAKVAVSEFKGELTGVTPRLIPNGFAEQSVDADLRERTLRGIRDQITAVGTDTGISNPLTIFRYRDQHWLAFTVDADVVRSPIADDPYKRIYWTGDGKPRMAAVDTATAGVPPFPNQSYDLGVPAPSGDIVAAGDAINEEPVIALDTAYVHTYVTVYGEEGPPSDPSNIVVRWDSDDGTEGYVDLTIPTIDSMNLDVTKYRIYRTESSGEYLFVAEVAAGVTTYRDVVKSEDLLTPLVSAEWVPPHQDMIGLTHGPADSMIGFFDNVLCLSEPGQPHAWPIGYRITMDDDIVAVAESAAGYVVGTKGKPVLLLGDDPISMQPQEIDIDQACLSKRGMVDVGPYAVYPSPDGLVAIGPGGARIITSELLERDEWATLNPYSFDAYRESDRYLCFYNNGTPSTFAFSPERGFEFISGWSSAAHYDRYDDVLYVANGTVLEKFDRGNRRTYRWRTGIYVIQPGTQFKAGKVSAAGYPVTLRGFVGGVEQWAITVTSIAPFRVPPAVSGPNTREWQFEVETDQEVFDFQIAQSMSEII